MPRGIINPNGRKDLNETARDMTPRFYGETDKQLGLTDEGKGRPHRKSPFEGINRLDTARIKEEIRRLFHRENTKKSRILALLRQLFHLNVIESENIYFTALTHNRVNTLRKKAKIKGRKKKRNIGASVANLFKESQRRP